MSSHPTPYLVELPRFGGPDVGHLSFFQNSPEKPFSMQRAYWVFGVPEGEIRGHHAHKELHQVLLALNGRIHLHLESLSGRFFEFVLSDPHVGVYVPPGHWRTLRFENQGVLLCLVSDLYTESDYVRNYEDFKRMQRDWRGI